MKIGKIKLWSRFNITTKILIVFLGLTLISLILLACIAHNNIKGVGDYTLQSSISLGESAVNDSAEALEDQAEEHLIRLVKDQAAISNTLFEKVEAEMNVVVKFAATLWSNPSSLGYRHSYSQEEEPDDIYATSVYVLASSAAVDAVREELNLSSNMDDIFIPIYANDPSLTCIYIGTESGIFRCYPWCSGFDPSYDPKKRGWYTRAVGTGEMGWTELYVDAVTGELMVTCSKPVHSPEGEIVGVVGADITLRTMNERIINTQVGELGYAFLLDNNGKVVARPGLSAGDTRWDETFDTQNLFHSDNPELRKIAENMTASNTGIARCRFEGGEKYIAYAPITCTNWSIGVVMPVEEIIAPALTTKSKIISATQDTGEHINRQINSMQKSFIGIFSAILLIVFGLTLLLSRLITNPIVALKKSSEIIGGGDLDHRVEVKTGDELEDLANSFNKMALDLKERMEELRRTTAEKERILKELEIARGIQQSFLPESVPEIKGVDLAAFNLPAREVGGDFYDFIPISADKWGLVIADVSGKGVPAALFMALSRTLVRANAVGNPTASEAIRRAGDLIAEDDRSGMFVTLFYGVLDSAKKTLTYVNAGHNPPLMLRRGDIITLKAKGIVLGIMPDIELEEKEISLGEGDIVVLYTDGVTESINDKEEQFGQERLTQVVEKGSNLSAPELVKRIEQEVAEFSRGQPQFDDITLLILKVAKDEKQLEDRTND